MGKKKSKKKKKNKNKGSGKNNHQGVEILGVDARQIGATLVGIVIGEVVEAATERLLRKATHANSSDASDHRSKNGESSDREHSHPIRSTIAQVENRLEDVGPAVGEATHAVRSSVSDLSPNLTEVIEVLRDAGQRLREKSMSTLNDSSETLVEGVKDSTKDAIDGITADIGLGALARSKKKKKKK